MFRGGIPTAQVEPYLHQRAWLTDAARLLGRVPDALAAELVQSMLRSGSVVARDGRIHAAAEHVQVVPGSLDVPFPRAWPST
jgi:hydroxyacylglutathione hydrolase